MFYSHWSLGPAASIVLGCWALGALGNQRLIPMTIPASGPKNQRLNKNMDILSHALWTNLIFKELPPQQRLWAISFGVMPDVVSFSLVTAKHFVQKTMHFTDPPISIFPHRVFRLYNITHSLVVWLGVFILLRLAGLEWWALAFMGWGLHILLDIFTHTGKFFPTPILWPFSRFHFSGINWSNKWFMLFNYAVLAFLYLVFYF